MDQLILQRNTKEKAGISGILFSGLFSILIIFITGANIGTVAAVYSIQLFLATLAVIFGSVVAYRKYGKTEITKVIWFTLAFFLLFLALISMVIFYDDGAHVFVGERAPEMINVLIALLPFFIYYTRQILPIADSLKRI